MATRMIDRNAHRWGAGISAVVLYLGLIFDWHWVAPLICVVLGVGTFFGLRYSPLGATYRFVKRTLSLDIPVVPEEEPPPRFAQLMGFTFLLAATFGFYGIENATVGWTLTMIVAALQTLLAGTGLCVGCEVYLIGKRLSARSAV
jgi:Domain of unknown function (DUF4395)